MLIDSATMRKSTELSANQIADETGFALAFTVFLMAMLTALTAAAFRMSRSEVQMGQNYRTANQGLFAAEAGVKHAVAVINQAGVVDLTSEVIDVWPDRRAPFSGGSSPTLQHTNFTYRVTITQDPYYPQDPSLPRDRNRALLRADGAGTDGALRTVFARIVRSGVPKATPGAIYLATELPSDATFRGDSFLVNGDDMYDGVPGEKPAVPGITTLTEANAEETRNSLNSTQKDNVQGLGYVADPVTPSVMAGTGPTAAQISRIIDDLLALPGVDTTTCSADGGRIAGNVHFGTLPAPRITYCNNGDGTIIRGTGSADGVGILIVEHALVIQGTLDFRGLVLVRGSTEVTEVTGNAYLQGSLWTTEFNLSVGGSAVVQYSSQALSLANQSAADGALPAPVEIVGWRDVF